MKKFSYRIHNRYNRDSDNVYENRSLNKKAYKMCSTQYLFITFYGEFYMSGNEFNLFSNSIQLNTKISIKKDKKFEEAMKKLMNVISND